MHNCKVDFYYHLWLQCCLGPLIPNGSDALLFFVPPRLPVGSINWIARLECCRSLLPSFPPVHFARCTRLLLLLYSARLIIYNTTGPGSTRLLSWSKRKENGSAVHTRRIYRHFRNLFSLPRKILVILKKTWGWLRSRKREIQPLPGRISKKKLIFFFFFFFVPTRSQSSANNKIVCVFFFIQWARTCLTPLLLIRRRDRERDRERGEKNNKRNRENWKTK